MLTVLCPLLRTKLLLRPARTLPELKGHTGQGRGGLSQVCSGFGVILTVRPYDPQCQLAVEALQDQSTEWPGCLLMIISTLNFFLTKEFNAVLIFISVISAAPCSVPACFHPSVLLTWPHGGLVLWPDQNVTELWARDGLFLGTGSWQHNCPPVIYK